ncbi:hypothetical protein ACFX1R_027469 [Malus domestica]
MRWLITLLNVEGSTASTCESSSMVYVNKLHELPLTIFQINRKVFQSNAAVHILLFLLPLTICFYVFGFSSPA